MKKYRLFNIHWETDEDMPDLPTETILEVEDDVDVQMEGADLLSDQYEWLVVSFHFEEAN